MLSLAALPLLVALAAPEGPSLTVVVTRRVGLDDVNALRLANGISAAIARDGGNVTTEPEPALAKLPALEISEAPMCGAKADCIARLGVLLGVQVVVSLEVGLVGETVALQVDAIGSARGVRLAQQTLVGPFVDLVVGKGIDLAPLLKTIREVYQSPKLAEVEPLVQATSASEPATAAAEAKPASRPGAPLRTVGFVLDGAGIALLAAGAVSGVLAKQSYDDALAKASAGAAYQDLKDTTRTRMIAADTLYATGAAVLVTGIVLTIVGWRDAPAAVAVSPLEGGAGLVASGSF